MMLDFIKVLYENKKDLQMIRFAYKLGLDIGFLFVEQMTSSTGIHVEIFSDKFLFIRKKMCWFDEDDNKCWDEISCLMQSHEFGFEHEYCDYSEEPYEFYSFYTLPFDAGEEEIFQESTMNNVLVNADDLEILRTLHRAVFEPT